jgi:hypothetical protein
MMMMMMMMMIMMMMRRRGRGEREEEEEGNMLTLKMFPTMMRTSNSTHFAKRTERVCLETISH